MEHACRTMPGQFDQIWSADAWHWVDPTAGYPGAAALLRPEGRLVATWSFSVVADQPLAQRLNHIYEQHCPDLCRDLQMPLGRVPLREGREEIEASGVMRLVAHWIDQEVVIVDGPTYVEWQLSFANIVSMELPRRQELAAAIESILAQSAHTHELPIEIYRYVVVSEPRA